MTVRQERFDLEYMIGGPVSAPDDSDITDDTVEWAFLAEDESPDETTDWTEGDWQAGGPPYFARILVGPGGDVDLELGTYIMWLRVTDTPEITIRPIERLIIYGNALSIT